MRVIAMIDQELVVISMKEVERLTSLSRTEINRKIAALKFPQPVELSSRRYGFYLHEVLDWIRNRPRRPPRPDDHDIAP